MARARRMLFCGFETHRANVSAWIAGFRFRAGKNAKWNHLIALFWPEWLFSKLGSGGRINHWQNCHI